MVFATGMEDRKNYRRNNGVSFCLTCGVAAHIAGALYGVCPEACLYYFGLSWWSVWFQFVILIASVPVGVRQ